VLIAREGGSDWAAAARVASEATGVPVRVCVVGRDGDAWDAEARWGRLSETNADGAVLVRPDNIVAWRATSFAQASELEGALRQITGH
jgi:2,4-dichlorophenol 6-monooxygenase